MWHVDTDEFPRSLYVLRDENGETLKTEARPGWYRTSSRAKAEHDCARLNRKEETMKTKTAETQQAEPITLVAFRFWYDGPGNRKSGEVVAIMPELPGDSDAYSCTCYVHTGQHGICNVHLAGQYSRPATEAEYAPLLTELERIGYRVRVIRRVNQRRYLDARRRELAAVAS
jgi:hypothetical protein